jgi:hypothetical protein
MEPAGLMARRHGSQVDRHFPDKKLRFSGIIGLCGARSEFQAQFQAQEKTLLLWALPKEFNQKVGFWCHSQKKHSLEWVLSRAQSIPAKTVDAISCRFGRRRRTREG